MKWLLPATLTLCLALLPATQGQEPMPKLLTPADATLLAYGDASALTADLAARTRYLWLPNLSAKERAAWKTVLDGHCNQLSRESDLTPTREVAGAAGHLLAVNLLDYGWDPKVWDGFAKSDPTFYATVLTEVEVTELVEYGRWEYPGGQKTWVKTRDVPEKRKKPAKVRALAPWLDPKRAAGLAALTRAKAPIVNALVFFANTASSGIGSPDYYDLQGIQDEAGYLKLVGAEVEKDVAFSTDLLAAIGISGVTQEPRAIQRVDKRGGALWSSFDKKKGKAIDQGNALRILGTDAKGKPFLDFDATEKYAHGANGLWKFYLGNAKGQRQARAPDEVAQDGQPILRNDHAVITCVSCIRCHADGGLQDLADWVRNFPPELDLLAGDRQGKKAVDPDDVRRLKKQYRRRLEPFLKADRDRYAAALLEATGLTPEKFASEFATAWAYAADSQVDLAWACRELGVAQERFVAAVKHQVALGKADPILAVFALPPAKQRPLPLSAWREAYPLAQQYLSELPK